MILALLLAATPAHALDLRWWGVGPTVGTMAIPGRYPSAFPAAVRTDGDPLVDKVRGDIEVGAHGVIYPGTAGRIFGIATLGFGTSTWIQPELVIGYDGIIVQDQEFQLLFGGGAGAGHETFRSAATGDVLKVNYFPLRAQLTALLRDKSRAYELGIWGGYHIPASQQYCVSGGECVEGKGDEAVAGALYATLGAEATLYFGDFRKKESSGKGKNKGKKQ